MSSALTQMQKIASNTQIQLQKMTDASTAKTFKYNTQEAKVSRDWQTEMSNTAHQREVKDLIKAGLNPVLSSGGSGAPAYTTSAASGSADNPANAVASIMSSRLSGIAGIAQSRMVSAAQIKAAQESAAAMRAAAASSAWATKYAADKAYDTAKYQTDNARVSNWSGLIDKYLHKFGLDEQVSKSQFTSGVKNSLNFILNPSQFDKQGTIKTFKQAGKLILNSNGIRHVKNVLRAFNVPYSIATQGLVISAFRYNNSNAQKQLANLIRIYNKGRSYK